MWTLFRRQVALSVEKSLRAALCGEVKIGDEKFVLEGKLIAEKNFAKINVAYNFIFEAEWEGESLSRLDEDAIPAPNGMRSCRE